MSETWASLTPQLARVRSKYLERLPLRVADITAQWNLLRHGGWERSGADRLHHLLHGLSGSSGCFGLSAISESAQAASALVRALAEAERPTTPEAPTPNEMRRLEALLNEVKRRCLEAEPS